MPHFTTFPNPAYFGNYGQYPDDVEAIDALDFQDAHRASLTGVTFDLYAEVDAFLDRRYPVPDPEPFEWNGQTYFLPALKVLYHLNGVLHSPVNSGHWLNGRLDAECNKVVSHYAIQYDLTKLTFTDWGGGEPPPLPDHGIPNERCTCGIYGSVNLDEIQGYLVSGLAAALNPSSAYGRAEDFSLCIIDPEPGAKVAIARKGWRASSAAIRHILRRDIGDQDAEFLISKAWGRQVPIQTALQNNRAHKHDFRRQE